MGICSLSPSLFTHNLENRRCYLQYPHRPDLSVGTAITITTTTGVVGVGDGASVTTIRPIRNDSTARHGIQELARKLRNDNTSQNFVHHPTNLIPLQAQP
jgi:hypothetical protein